MRNSIAVMLVLLLVTTTLALSADDPGEIVIGTFNLQKFGQSANPERSERIAKICQGIDVLAIQEIHPDGSGTVEALAGIMGPEYRCVISSETTWERFAFIWRAPVTLLEPAQLMEDLNLGRKPFRGVFRAGNFDFELINVHLFWDGSKKTYPHTRSVEFKLLDDWLCYRQDEELDVIFAGDFNSPNMYYRTQFPPILSSHYYFYDFLSRHGLISISIEKGIPTSIANQNIYDHLIFNPSHNFVEEFSGFENAAIVKWETPWDKDGDGKLSWTEHVKASQEVTDHRLVKARFRINMPDDDEEEIESKEVNSKAP